MNPLLPPVHQQLSQPVRGDLTCKRHLIRYKFTGTLEFNGIESLCTLTSTECDNQLLKIFEI
jgi:hypothetical protein